MLRVTLYHLHPYVPRIAQTQCPTAFPITRFAILIITDININFHPHTSTHQLRKNRHQWAAYYLPTIIDKQNWSSLEHPFPCRKVRFPSTQGRLARTPRSEQEIQNRVLEIYTYLCYLCVDDTLESWVDQQSLPRQRRQESRVCRFGACKWFSKKVDIFKNCFCAVFFLWTSLFLGVNRCCWVSSWYFCVIN